jgi:Flp pilus assembly protein TadG
VEARSSPIRRRHIASARGAALVELAASILVIALVLVFTADFARIYHHVIDLENAARAGAQYGQTNSSDTAGMKTAAINAAPDTPLSTSTVSATQNCWCASDDGSTYTSGVDCSDECADPNHLIVKVTVTASYTFTTFARIAPIPSSLTISRTATLRAE